MYLKKQKQSGTGHISLKLFERIGGKEILLKYLGTAKNQEELNRLTDIGREKIWKIKTSRNLPLFPEPDDLTTLVDRLEARQISTVGLHDVFGVIYKEIGFGEIDNKFLKDLVIARLGFPGSKRKTASYLYDYCGRDISLDRIYRFMDKLDLGIKDRVCQTIINYLKARGNSFGIVFFDATTLHFEAFDEDDFRRFGYSKVGKFNQPQIIIALIVDRNGTPISFETFEGNVFEGHTLIPVLEKFKDQLGTNELVVVADSAMLSETNLSKLEASGYEYIVGARIKNLSAGWQGRLCREVNSKQTLKEFAYENRRLIVGYSQSRAENDAHNRHRAILRLEKKMRRYGNLKSFFSNQSLKKYLKVENVQVAIDYQRIELDKKWDGLKGYVTNSRKLSLEDIVANYSCLWRVEKAFRMSKSDLVVRPVYHYKKNRIQAHILLVFMALVIGKVAENLMGRSLEKIVESLKLVRIVLMHDKTSEHFFQITSSVTEDQKMMYQKVGLVAPENRIVS